MKAVFLFSTITAGLAIGQIKVDLQAREQQSVGPLVQARRDVVIKTSAVLIRADEVDFHWDTGEAEARGNVRVKFLQEPVRSLTEHCEKLLDIDPKNSLSRYRIAEILFRQNNYQDAANEFRGALNGDLEPRWIEVWSHIHLGKIFDVTGQRKRAIREYQQAQWTGNDSQGALEEAAKYLQEPFKRTGQ